MATECGAPYNQTDLTLQANELSCCFWFMPPPANVGNGKYNIVASNYAAPSTGFWISTNCESSGLWFFNGKYCGTKQLLSPETWYHCCFTFNNGVGKWYINGEEAELNKNTLTSTYLTINNLTIGDSYVGTTWDTEQRGLIMDFRVYTTVLTAADIKELYQTSVSIDADKNLYAREISENMIHGLEISQQGFIRASSFYESDSIQKMTGSSNLVDTSVNSNYFYEY